MPHLFVVGIVLAIVLTAWSTISSRVSSLGQETGVFDSEHQVPLAHAPTSPELGLGWNLNVGPAENDTGHLIFQSVSSLLQHWPNARYRNGHTIVPGTIPPGTTLYHGRSDPTYPSGAEWLATDPEHSFLFCKRPCWHLTVVTTRPLKVLYFDGSSAVKMHGGSMDSQDMLLWGERRAEKVFSEEERLAQLCEWGREFGLDGFVRMEMNFEVMLCDFASGVETVSFLHLANASPPDPKPASTSESSTAADLSPDSENETDQDLWEGPGPNPAVTIRNFELMHSSLQYTHYPGDMRIKLDLTRLVSFYDPDVAPSLFDVRSTVEGRWMHELVQMCSVDIDGFRKKLRESLSNLDSGDRTSSGVDWEALIQVIIKRYGSRLESLTYVLGAKAGSSESTIADEDDRALKAFAQVNVMLSPYITLDVKLPRGAAPLSESDEALRLAWASPVYELCSTSLTSYISSSSTLSRRMTSSERLLLGAVEATTREICRILTGIWATGIEAGLNERYWESRRTAIDQDAIRLLVKSWHTQVQDLMQWLDWHLWVRCKPACGDEEICYMPTWPYFGGPPPGPAAGPSVPVDDDPGAKNDRDRPMPKCIRRIAPYSF